MNSSLPPISRRGLSLVIGTAFSLCSASASAGRFDGSGQSAMGDNDAVVEGRDVLDGAMGNTRAGVARNAGPGPGVLAPQIPSYLVAPLALLAYGDTLINGLHQRLGDFGWYYGSVDLGGEVFARYTGSVDRYTSSRGLAQYGYGFAQKSNALQVGGNLVTLAGDSASLRAGWALDHGTTRVMPKDANSGSDANYTGNGASAWITWRADNGLYLDGVVGGRRYVGDISASRRGTSTARIHASATFFSVEADYPFDLSPEWVLETQFQVKYQSLIFRDVRDADGLDVHLGAAGQSTARLGVLITRTRQFGFMPYGRIDVVQTNGGAPNVDVTADEAKVSASFGTARTGSAVKVSLGAFIAVSPHVQVYGEGSYQQYLGSFGLQGYAANVGVRLMF